jgi:serine/threonine protein phosphatase PrpC
VGAFELVRYAQLTDVGVKRSHNQDACTSNPAVDVAAFENTGHIFVVADGMGGHAVGEKASAKAVRDIPFLYSKHARDGVIAAIRRAFQETNAGIYAIGQQNPEFRGLGTTSTALILRPEGAWVGHVGDSRIYRIRNGKAEQLTFDHSWVWEIARRQGVDPDELGDFKKNVIIRSLGPDPEVEVDIEGPHPIQPGDCFLLCSDGLTGVVSPQEVGAIVSAMSPEEAVRFLVHLANLRGGPDNITVLVVQVPGGNVPGAGVKGKKGPGGKRLGRVWPFLALGIGIVAAVATVLMHVNEEPSAPVFFVLTAALIITGVIGLLVKMQKEPPPEALEQASEAPRELHVYKSHDCSITPELTEKFAQTEATLLEGMRGQGVPADFEAHAKLAAASDAAVGKPNALESFRARCASLLFLAEAFHKARHKQESFQPSWTPSQSQS